MALSAGKVIDVQDIHLDSTPGKGGASSSANDHFLPEGMTLEETARTVAAEVGTVKARLHRARGNLRSMLEPLRSINHDR